MSSQGSSVASAKPTKRKATAPPKAKNKKGKKVDPASTVEVFGTKYGKMMFGNKGRFHLTPAESAHAGLLVQAQKWFLNKAGAFGVNDMYAFTQAFVDECQKDELAITEGGEAVESISLSVFVKLIDAVGKFCNFDKELDLTWKLGNVLGSKCNALTKVDQAAEHFMLHMRNHFLMEASDQRKDGGSKLSLIVSLLKRMKRDHKQAKTKEAFVEWFKDRELMQQGPDSYWTSYPGLPYELEGLDSIEKRKRIYQKLVKDFMRSGAAIDKNIGKILDYLDESGLAENTVVIYAADQGYFLGEHGFFDKRLIYEESLRMPFVIRYPKEIEAGARIKEMILNIDFAPLMADYAGIEKPIYMQGKSFRALLNGKKTLPWRNEIYYRYWLHHPDRPAHFGIRNERYKLAYFYGKGLNKKGVHPTHTKPEWEFYDLQEDPKENYNAIANPKYKELIKNMKTALIKLREQYGDTDPDHPELQLAISQEP